MSRIRSAARLGVGTAGERFALSFNTSARPAVDQGRFLQLLPGKRIVQAVEFASDRPEFAGTMTINWSLSATPDGALVTIIAEDVLIGISRANHELGMASTLENLVRFVE
jgi:hypothetical protein